MWRLANCIYRAFRNTATHRCPQDVFVPLSTICNTDDDKDAKKDAKQSQTRTCDIYQVLKQNQFSYSNIDKLQEHLRQFSVQKILAHKLVVVKPVEPPRTAQPLPTIEQTLESLVNTDAACTKTIKELSDLHDETMSMINLEMALDALESGNVQFGIEALQASAQSRTNAAALYNLGLCYEQGVGVAQDRARACDHFRWATALGHTNAQLHLSRLSNDIDLDDNDADADDTLTEASGAHPDPAFFRWASPPIEQAEHRFDLQNQTVVCLA